jgi:nucleotide-binding universal stress UspA family protein
MKQAPRILVPYDYSELSDGALAYARRLAGALAASVHVFHAAGTVPPPGDTEARLAETLHARELDAAPPSRPIVRPVGPTEGIRSVADELDADLVVMGTHARTGLARLVFGSVAESVVHACARPVLALQAGTPADRLPKRLVVATDFSATAARALAWATSFARLAGASITIVHALPDPLLAVAESSIVAPEAIAQELESAEVELGALCRGVAGVPVEGFVRIGGAETVLADVVAEVGADLVVLGTHARTGLARALFGSVAEAVLRTATVPVVVVRAPG